MIACETPEHFHGNWNLGRGRRRPGESAKWTKFRRQSRYLYVIAWLARSPGNRDAEPSKVMGSQARCTSRRIAVLCLAIRLWSGCQAGYFLYTETARGRRRTTERSPPPPPCRHWRRNKILPASPDRDRQSEIAGRQLPKEPAQRLSVALRGPPAVSVKKNADRTNERAICTLPMPGTPRISPTPKGAIARHVMDKG